MERTVIGGVRWQNGRALAHCMLDCLGRAIVTGSYDKLTFPTEAELTKQYGVSHSVTREAIEMLTAKGLVSARPRLGTVIEGKASWNLFDLDVLRWLLERGNARPLLRHLTELRVAI